MLKISGAGFMKRSHSSRGIGMPLPTSRAYAVLASLLEVT